MSFLDAWFLSSSALSGTGLTTITLTDYLNPFSEFCLMLEMQIGGIGIMVVIGGLILIIQKEMSLPQITLMGFGQNQRNIKNMIFFIVSFSLAVELIGMLLVFPAVIEHTGSMPQALMKSAFHSISSFTHASLDLFGGNVYPFTGNPLFLLTTVALITIGGLGFPTIWELIAFRKHKKSLFTKVNLRIHGLLLLGGTLLLLLIEWNGVFSPLSVEDKLSNGLFLSAGSRNSGYSSVDLALLNPGSLMLIMVLMFIGGSASSCAGGIRMTTLAVLAAKAKSAFQGKADIVIMKKSLYDEDVMKAYLMFFVFASLYLFSTILLVSIERHPPEAVAFEVMSAMTSTGFSVGITPGLTAFSQIWLSILMIIGKIGLIPIVYSVMDAKKSAIKYAKESIMAG
ncbi:potassium transporter TrkG [Paenibacillus sp. LHD-117]|uniref:potassium transporter TrkG n=1 Tax=Paenibacillus sp. LHD-117 TaxID=3071412 RepID=UPI0027E16B96|nr:potassium transporter TrkG [Paenibacillus sp. LHD-117]MDQ6421293.1 potassium transporter TrkG [Paenibacillus sp. LHD-117]